MGHKTITISDEAYRALAHLKRGKESFTEVILRLAKRRTKSTLLDYVRSLEPDEEFAEIMEDVLKERRRVRIRTPRL
ncbi:MAG: antitoxin VapB family protein [Candidatus Brockarchaeota archaeon]|nr:antitoxin VapB family protein [Candidatus Brockarchaeota archaeon]MBO3809776.1 antitoxin VapB family protein [Candidatus Brockarchaeota archaeon]